MPRKSRTRGQETRDQVLLEKVVRGAYNYKQDYYKKRKKPSIGKLFGSNLCYTFLERTGGESPELEEVSASSLFP